MNPVVLSVYEHYEIANRCPELSQYLPARVLGPPQSRPHTPRVSQQLQQAFAKVLRGEARAEVVLAQLQAGPDGCARTAGQPKFSSPYFRGVILMLR